MAHPIISQQRMLKLLEYSSDNYIQVMEDRCIFHVNIVPDKGGRPTRIRPFYKYYKYYKVHWNTLFKLLMNGIIWAKPNGCCTLCRRDGAWTWTPRMICKIRR